MNRSQMFWENQMHDLIMVIISGASFAKDPGEGLFGMYAMRSDHKGI